MHRTLRVPGARERLRLCGRGVSAGGGRLRCAESVARRVEIADKPAFQLLPLLLVRIHVDARITVPMRVLVECQVPLLSVFLIE